MSIYLYMNKYIVPTSCTPGIHLKNGEARGSKNMMGQARVGNKVGGTLEIARTTGKR